MNSIKDVPRSHPGLSLVGLVVQISAAGVVYLAVQLAHRAYDIVIPGQALPRLTQAATYSAWLFLGMSLVFFVCIALRRLRADTLMSLLIVDVGILLAVLWGLFLPFGLMSR